MRTAGAISGGVPWELLVLKPQAAPQRSCFGRVTYDGDRHAELLREMQRLRGRVYLEDGAVDQTQLTSDGRHILSCDYHSWHLLVMRDDRVEGCIRYRTYPYTLPFQQMSVAHSGPARCASVGPCLRAAVEREIRSARQQGVAFGEVGGWALDKKLRGSTAALRMILATYSLSQLLGDAIGLSTATLRNSSAMILSRLGGMPFVVDNTELPPYYDPQYRCEMSLLKFDSRAPSPKYRDGVAQHRTHLLNSLVVSETQAFKVRSAAAAAA